MIYKNLVSIIIPTYNYGEFLPDAVESIFNQTYQEWECLIIDDGSTDNTKDIAHSVLLNDNRVSYYYQNRKGTSAAKNLGLKYSKGNFIQFLDADDILEDNKLEKHVSYLSNHKKCDLVYGPSLFFCENNKSLVGYSKEFGQQPWAKQMSGQMYDVLPYLIKQNFLTISAPLFRRCSKTIFDERLASMEDWHFWINYFQSHNRLDYLNGSKTSTLIRVHNQNTSSNYAKMVRNEFLMRKYLNFRIGELNKLNDMMLIKSKEKYVTVNRQLGFNNLYQGSVVLGLFQITEAIKYSGKFPFYFWHSLYWLKKRFQ